MGVRIGVRHVEIVSLSSPTVEATDSESVQSEFESLGRHRQGPSSPTVEALDSRSRQSGSESRDGHRGGRSSLVRALGCEPRESGTIPDSRPCGTIVRSSAVGRLGRHRPVEADSGGFNSHTARCHLAFGRWLADLAGGSLNKSRARGRSCTGAAPVLQAGVSGFESHRFHQNDIGLWRSLVALPLWERRVAGSNPAGPTCGGLPVRPWQAGRRLRIRCQPVRMLRRRSWRPCYVRDRAPAGECPMPRSAARSSSLATVGVP